MDDDLARFDGATDPLRAWLRGIRPDPDLTVSEWTDRHRMLASRASAEPGRYRTARTPYMREIMDRLESWLVDHVVIDGGPGDPACWQQLTDLLRRTWAHANGQHLTIARLAIDTGFETSAVYGWARQVGFAQVAPVKGVEGFSRASPVTGPTYVDATLAGKRLRQGARLWTVATATFKAETYRFLRQERPTAEEIAVGASFPAGTVHLPTWADGEWLRQLTAEQLVTVKTRRGFSKLEWQKLRERNEALDCRVYARAAAWIAGADRWSEARWAELERLLAEVGSARDDAESGNAANRARPSGPRRRKVQSSYMV